MNTTMFKQNTLRKLDAIYSIKKSMDKWLTLWAEDHCPVRVGDIYPVWVGEDPKYMVVSKVTALLVQDRKFVWKITGIVYWSWGDQKISKILEMEE